MQIQELAVSTTTAVPQLDAVLFGCVLQATADGSLRRGLLGGGRSTCMYLQLFGHGCNTILFVFDCLPRTRARCSTRATAMWAGWLCIVVASMSSPRLSAFPRLFAPFP